MAKHTGRQVPVGCERREVGGQTADHAWKDEDQPEESEAVQGRDVTSSFRSCARNVWKRIEHAVERCEVDRQDI